jgi:tetratricopeptide (TPR) repeat protein
MFCFPRALAALLAVFLQFTLVPFTLAEDTEAPATPPELAAGEQLYRTGKFVEAEAGYRAALKTDSKLVAAQVGLVRSMLRQQKIDEAFNEVNAALTVAPDSAPLLAAKGDVQFRRGEMSDAEVSYLVAKKLDHKEVHAYLGLGRVYSAYSLYHTAYVELQAAHEIAPDDIEVRRMWLRMLPRKERLAALEKYLNEPHPDDEEETRRMTEYLEFLRATIDKPIHACKLVSQLEQTETRLETVYFSDQRSIHGIGLTAKLNDRNVHLLLDTGAGGIIVTSKVAEKAGLSRVSTAHFVGIGDKGLQSGYTAVAEHIRIGELEFEDCVVAVSDRNSLTGVDGLIGADVFGSYLVDIDLPGERLKLSPLPKRPEDTATPKSLNSEGEEQVNAEQREGGAAEQTSPQQKSSVPTPQNTRRTPKDRYIAPEMTNWTKVFRFGHAILVPTSVNDSKPMLFGLDTGAFSNILSLRAGRLMGKVNSDYRLRVQGLNGAVNKVYNSDKAVLSFGHFRQSNTGIVTLDLSTVSRLTGTEVSGFLGFAMLKHLELKLDYRDGLVDFVYDPKHDSRR